MSTKIPKEDIAGVECIHACYFTDKQRENDIVVVKEHIHSKDGSRESNLRIIQNYKKDFFVTREKHRNHADKKEWEDLSKLQKFSSTQVKMGVVVARALGKPVSNPRLSFLARSPFLYGTDVSSSVLIKNRYIKSFEKFNDASYPSDVAVLDYETNTVFENLSKQDQDRWYKLEDNIIRLRKRISECQSILESGKVTRTSEKRSLASDIDDCQEKIRSIKKTQEMHATPIITGSLTMKDKVFVVITEQYASIMPDMKSKIEQCFDEQLAKYKKDRNIKLEIVTVKHDGDATRAILAKAHEWQPDFVVIWNITFDVNKMLESCTRHHINPEDIFCDPSIPPAYRSFNFKQGQLQKTTATGKVTSQHPADLWHTVFAPASFYFIDAMCLYKRLRVTEAQQPSYSLDAILGRELNLGKLKFDAASQYQGLKWHQVMQTDHRVEYVVYNIFDCIGVELLEEKNNDIKTMRMLLGHSDLSRFTSTPRRLCDDLHFVVLEQEGKAMASTSDSMEDDLDKYVVDMTDWIVTLPSHLTAQRGLKILEELPDVESSLNINVADLDVAGAYPHGEIALNCSKETTWREVSRIKGKPEKLYRTTALNMTAPRTNAVHIATTVLDMPDMPTLLEAFNEQHK